jgi:hypothetical protein
VQSENDYRTNPENIKIILGRKLNNPYSVESMQDAFNYYNSLVEDSQFNNKVVNANYYHIKITPRNEQELEFLDSFENNQIQNYVGKKEIPVFFDYPLGYEIIENGDYFAEPVDESDLYHPIYTVVSKDFVEFDHLDIEIIDYLYYPREEEFDVETVSFVLNGFEDQLRFDDLSITLETLPDYLRNLRSQQQMQFMNIFGRKWKPKGRITVKNTENNIAEGLSNAVISYGSWFWWHYTNTDELGNYNAERSCRGEINIRGKWRGNFTIRKSWTEILGIKVSDHFHSMNRHNNNRLYFIDYSTSSSTYHLWYKATIHNGLIKYNKFANHSGIIPVYNLNVWCTSGSSSSAPMFYNYPLLIQDVAFQNLGLSNWNNVFVNFLTSIGSLIVGILPNHLRPDHAYGINSKRINNIHNSLWIHQTVAHESSHSSHSYKAGTSFWALLVSSEFYNDSNFGGPYGNGMQPNPTRGDIISIAEGWAYFTEVKCSLFNYGKSHIRDVQENLGQIYNLNTSNNLMENFDVYDKPMSFTRTLTKSWFMTGIFWDLLDNNSDTLSRRRNGTTNAQINLITDNYSIAINNNQLILSPIYNRLTGNIRSANDLRQALVSHYGLTYPNQNFINLNDLFCSYGYYCQYF